MASIAKRPDGRWRARYRDAAGQRARAPLRPQDRRAALARLGDRRRQTGTYVDPAGPRITVGELRRLWLAGKINLKPTTRARYEDVLRTHVLPRWARRPARPRRARRHPGRGSPSSPAAGLAGASVRKAHGVLSGILGLAVRDRRLPSNPALGVELPPLARSAGGYLTAAQVEALAEAAGPGPARRPRARLLRPALVRARRAAGPPRRPAAPPADHRGGGDRDQRRPHRLGHAEVARAPLGADPALPRRRTRRRAGRQGPATTWPSPRPTGAVLRNRNARSLWFDQAAAAIGQPGLTPHELRHTAASLAVSAGANVKAVQRMLGHASRGHDARPLRGPVRRRPGRGRRPAGRRPRVRVADLLRTFCGPKPS